MAFRCSPARPPCTKESARVGPPGGGPHKGPGGARARSRDAENCLIHNRARLMKFSGGDPAFTIMESVKCAPPGHMSARKN